MWFIDANSKDQILYFNDLIFELEKGNDIAVLSRYIHGGGDEREFIRVSTSKLINYVCKLFLRINFNDFTSGIFLMKRSVLNHLNIQFSGHGEYFIELIYKASKKNYRIIEVPYVQKKDKLLGKSKSNPNLFRFFYLGFMYFFRIILTLFKN